MHESSESRESVSLYVTLIMKAWLFVVIWDRNLIYKNTLFKTL